MKKRSGFLFMFVLALVLVTTSSIPGRLSHGEPAEEEVSQLAQNAPAAEEYPDASVLNLLDECVVEVFRDGRCRETHHVALKVLRESGKPYGDIEIGYNSRTDTASVLYARTTTPEGKIIPLNENAVKVVTPFTEYPDYSDYKELTFSMPGVTLGSIIHYKVVIEKKPKIEGKFSGGFCFQSYNPTRLARYKVIAPEGMEPKYHPLNPLQGIESSPEIIREGDRKIYLWEYKDVPQVMSEKSMPPAEEVAFQVLVTTMNSWEEFSRWWRKKIEGKTEPGEGITKKVAELTQDLSTPREKIEALFDYVKREIRYVSIDFGKSGYEPESAQKVFENKYGDCKDKSTLLISMLREAGIPAYYVLIPTAEMRNLVREFPYPFQFDHCIVAVKNESGYHFMDPVASSYRFDYLPGMDQNRDVLIIKGQEDLFCKTPLVRPEENAYYGQSKIKIGPDGSIEGETKESGVGGREASMRSFYIKSKPTKIKEGIEERVYDISPGARLLTYTHSDPLNFRERFELKINYTAPDYCKKGGDILIFDVPEVRRSCPAVEKKTRKHPIVISTNSYSKVEVVFNIPEGYEVHHLPETLEIENPYFEFRSTYRQEGDTIVYQLELTRNATRIPPGMYASYQGWCQGMEKSFNRSVLFKKKEG